MGITNRLLPNEPTSLCDTVADPEDRLEADGLSDLDHFARFVRATKAPSRDIRVAATSEAKNGRVAFETIGCGNCHLHTLVTAPAGTVPPRGAHLVPPAPGGP